VAWDVNPRRAGAAQRSCTQRHIPFKVLLYGRISSSTEDEIDSAALLHDQKQAFRVRARSAKADQNGVNPTTLEKFVCQIPELRRFCLQLTPLR
jgi:hypothetical protein